VDGLLLRQQAGGLSSMSRQAGSMGWGGLFVGYFPRISRHSWAIVLPIMPSRRARRAAKMIVCTIFNTFFGSLEPI